MSKGWIPSLSFLNKTKQTIYKTVFKILQSKCYKGKKTCVCVKFFVGFASGVSWVHGSTKVGGDVI